MITLLHHMHNIVLFAQLAIIIVQYTEGLYAILLHIIFFHYSVCSPPGLSLDVKKSTYKKVQRFIVKILWILVQSNGWFPVVNLNCTVS